MDHNKCNTTPPNANETCTKIEDCPPQWMKKKFGSVSKYRQNACLHPLFQCNENCWAEATLECVEEDKVVEDALCPVDKPNILINCNDTCDKCNPDGSCKLKPECRDDSFCDALDKMPEAVRKKYLCASNCCKCTQIST